MVEVLDKMPASTVNIADYDGRTPLHVAVEQSKEVVSTAGAWRNGRSRRPLGNQRPLSAV